MPKLVIAFLLLFMTCTAVAENHYGYYRIHRDSAETWKEIDKNIAAISANMDTIRTVSTELASQISQGIEKNGIKEVKTHQKFYYPILMFGLMYLIWLKTRDR